MIFCLHHSPIRFGNQHIAGSQRVLLWYAETPHPVQVQRPWRRWSYHPCKIRPSVWWLTAKSLSFCQCNRHLQCSCGIWLSRPLAKRRWRSVKSGWPTSWSTGVSAGSTTCLRWRDHGSLCSVSLVLSAELHGAFGVSSQDYLYGESTKFLSYNDFVNKELVLFSNSDNERSIPCLVDGGSESSAVTKNGSWIWSHALLCVCVCTAGLKPGHRKVLFCCFKRNDKREVKVAQLAGSVAEMSAYHHGEVSWRLTWKNVFSKSFSKRVCFILM